MVLDGFTSKKAVVSKVKGPSAFCGAISRGGLFVEGGIVLLFPVKVKCEEILEDNL